MTICRTIVLKFTPIVAASILMARAVVGQELNPHIDIGSRKQLLVDDYLIAVQNGVRQVMHQAKKANDGKPVRFWKIGDNRIRKPLRASIYASPMYDTERGVFRMWSRVYPGLNKDHTPEEALEGSESHKFMRYGYSESKNGLDFDFVGELRGLHSSGDYNSVVTFDEHESDPAHRYKIGYDGTRGDFPNGACLAYSANGLEWTPYNNGNPVTGRAADFTNCLIWDNAARTYRLFTRTDYGTAGGASEIRGMRMMTNPDVKANPADWKTIRQWKFDREGPDEHRRRQIYSMTGLVFVSIHRRPVRERRDLTRMRAQFHAKADCDFYGYCLRLDGDVAPRSSVRA